MSDVTATPAAASAPQPRTAKPGRRALARFTSNRLAVFGLIVLVFFLLFCFLGPLFYQTDQVHTNLAEASLRPGERGHLLGTDDVGYDVLGRLMIAGQTSIIIGLAAGVLATLIGSFWGAIAGYVGGWVDSVMMRIVDAGIAIPATFLLLIISTIARPSVPLMIVVIGLVSWLVPARLVRAESISLKSREYVLAIRAMGGTHSRAITRHIIPNSVGTIIVNATFQVADAILLVAYISFLGMGVQKPATDWGAMLTSGISYTYAGAWWLILPAGFCIVLIVVAFNCIGDGLRDYFDVKGRLK
ncbi:ABC transporter permease [Mycetocola tolaasinivorans]|uniref:ABC transporter permease n=1 Tax=Mycetocola tolaasinivorans TaxID=76635 RepID=A0A3L7A6W1_9MICO|nr:ABC transporter permease [Mycetocola tolaasinivorans]RLP76076.1 ABC transporter permease [Mycetocola tolaasinivorans]